MKRLLTVQMGYLYFLLLLIFCAARTADVYVCSKESDASTLSSSEVALAALEGVASALEPSLDDSLFAENGFTQSLGELASSRICDT